MNRRAWIGVTAVAAIALAGAACAVGYVWGAAQEPEEPLAERVADGEPHIVDADELQELEPILGTVYWLGERDGTDLELTVSSAMVLIRYLPDESSAGDAEKAISVATYRDLAGYGALEALGDSAELSTSDSGALIAVPEANPKSTYFAFPSGAFQVEVFSPEDGESFELVGAGDVFPLGLTDGP